MKSITPEQIQTNINTNVSNRSLIDEYVAQLSVDKQEEARRMFDTGVWTMEAAEWVK